MTKKQLAEAMKDLPDDAEICLLTDEYGSIYKSTSARAVTVHPMIGNRGPFYCEAPDDFPNSRVVLVID